MKTITILVNNDVVYEFDKDVTFEEQQLEFLNKMDSDMDRGFKIQGELINNPDSKQRATFVAMNLVKALQQDNQAIITASCAYLVTRQPALVEVHARDQGGAIVIEFVEEH